MSIQEIINKQRSPLVNIEYTFPIYKAFAKTCNFNTWLRVHGANKMLALWMLKWCQFEIGTIPYHISLKQYEHHATSFNDLKILLGDYQHLQGLTITGKLLIPEIINEINLLCYLNEIVLLIDTNIEIPILPLRCLETIFISNLNNHQIFKTENLNKIKHLKNFYYKGKSIQNDLIQTLTMGELSELSLVATEIPMEIEPLMGLFRKIQRISVVNCGQTLYDALFISNAEHITALRIENTQPQIIFDFQKITNFKRLNTFKIRLELNSSIQYTNFIKLIRTVAIKPDIHWNLVFRLAPLASFQYEELQFSNYLEIAQYVQIQCLLLSANSPHVVSAIQMS